MLVGVHVLCFECDCLSVHNRTRAMNIFLHAYQKKWFDSVEKGSHLALREKLIVCCLNPHLVLC